MNAPASNWAAPTWSWGLGLRREHFDDLEAARDEVGFLEVLNENVMSFGGRPKAALERLRRHLPVVLHGVGLSIGSPDPLDETYLGELAALAEWTDPPWFSDHLSYSSAFGVDYHDLIPLPFSDEAATYVAARAAEVQRRMGRPFLLENPSYYVRLPGGDLTEAEFFRRVVERADCGILLDINNVYVNAQNHGYDPDEFLDQIPLERVSQVHIAGHDAGGDFIIDTHGAHLAAPVVELYGRLVARLVARDHPVWTLLEWDHGVPPLETLLAENRWVIAAAPAAGAPPEGRAA